MRAGDGAPTPAGRAAHPWLVVLALAPGIILTLADATIMTITVQAIIRQVGGSVVSVSWVMNGYNLVLTVLFLTMGRLGDRYGHRLVFALGLAVFTAASLPCALATGIPELVAWRVVQAIGAAAVVPTALALLLQAFPERRQGFAAGLFGAVSSLALALGPVLGGALVWYRGWPAVFWFNLPVGIVGVVLALALTRDLRTPRTRTSLDWPGVGLVSAGLFCVTLAIIQGNDWGWASGAVIGLFAAGAALLVLWVRWELRTPAPLFDLRLFRDRTFAAAAAAVMTVDTALMGAMFMSVIFMIAMMNFTELRAGLAIATIPVAVMVLTPPAGWLADRIGPRWLAVAGALLTAAGLVALGSPRAHRPGEQRGVARRARRRRHRTLTAGAARRRHERRPRGPQGRGLGHAEHGPPARLPPRGRDPRGGVRPHDGAGGEPQRRRGPGARPRSRTASAGPSGTV